MPLEAVIERVVVAATADVTIGKVTVLAPAGTVTLAGTVADESLDTSVTTSPLDGATPERKTEPVVVTPPVTELGAIVM